jgi:hypothetical protein
MIKIYKFCIPLLFFIVTGFYAQAQTFDFSKPDSMKSEQIHADAKHYKYIYNSTPWNINITEINLIGSDITFSAVKGMDRIADSREKLSKVIDRITGYGKKVIAGINADFFYPNGDLVSNQISEGEFVKGTKSKRSQIAFSYTNNPNIDRYQFTGKIISKDSAQINIDGCNLNRGFDSVVIYNHYWGKSTDTRNDGIEYVIVPVDSIKNNKISRAVITAINNNNSEITRNHYVISASGKLSEKIKKFVSLNDTVSIYLMITPATEQVKELTGGLTQIIKNGIDISGEQALAEGAGEKFVETRHPRTAVGYNKEKTRLFFVTVDGRQKISAGMSLKELACFMLYLKCYDALNLDGGGSTTMIINNKIVNSPSDLLGERSTGNSLLLLTK